MISVFNKKLFWYAILLCIVFVILGLVTLMDVNSDNQISLMVDGNFVSDTNNKENVHKMRIIHFPKDRSMGLVYVGDLRTTDSFWWQGWEIIGEAKGVVEVPTNKAVRLSIRAETLENLSSLTGLKPDDIQALRVSITKPDRIDEVALESITKLSGLKLLTLRGLSVTAVGIANLARLNKLEFLSLAGEEITNDMLEPVGRIGSLLYLDLGATPITDEGLVHLRNLSSLQTISLYNTNITGVGFSHLAGLESLTYAHLSNSEITDEGLRELAKLKSLEKLWLHGTKVGNKGLAHLSKSTSLRELMLQKTNVTNEGLNYIAKLKLLEKLELPRGTTDAGLEKLKDLKKLKHLHISKMQLTGAGLETLKEFKLLEYLQLPQGINDKDLAVVKGLSSLEELWIQNSPVTNEGLANLTLLKSLRKLGLHNGRNDKNMEITGSGLAYLKGLPLTYLWLWQIKLDDSRLNYIAGFTQLEELHIRQMPLRDEDLVSLSNLTNLKRLRFDSDTVSDGGISYLADLTSLEDLDLWVPMSDVGLSYLANMKMLDRLQIKGDFSDESLRHLEKLKALRTLRITSGNDFSHASLEQLEKKLPILQSFKVIKSREIKSRPKAREVAPTFSLKTLDGKKIKLEDYRGKAVLLYFWATWCSPCVASTPGLKKFYEELSQYDGFAMISLSLDEDESGLRRYIERNGITWPQARLGLHSQVAADYGVSGVPAYFLVGPNGRIFSTDRNWDKLKAAVIRALGVDTDKKSNVLVESEGE